MFLHVNEDLFMCVGAALSLSMHAMPFVLALVVVTFGRVMLYLCSLQAQLSHLLLHVDVAGEDHHAFCNVVNVAASHYDFF